MNDTEASQLNILKFDLKEIQNQISHLVRSNKELEDAIKAKEDDEFSLAIKENTVKKIIENSPYTLKICLIPEMDEVIGFTSSE